MSVITRSDTADAEKTEKQYLVLTRRSVKNSVDPVATDYC